MNELEFCKTFLNSKLNQDRDTTMDIGKHTTNELCGRSDYSIDLVIRPLARNEYGVKKQTKSIKTTDEGSNGLYIASHLARFMCIQIKFYPSKGWGWTGGWLRACPLFM